MGRCFCRDCHVHAEEIARVGWLVSKLVEEVVALCEFEGGDRPDVRMTIMREVDAKMITKEFLVVARVEARAETVSADNSQSYKKRWVSINLVEVIHEINPVAGQ